MARVGECVLEGGSVYLRVCCFELVGWMYMGGEASAGGAGLLGAFGSVGTVAGDHGQGEDGEMVLRSPRGGGGGLTVIRRWRDR